MKHEIRNVGNKGSVLWLTDGKTQVGIALDFGIRVVHLSCAGMENLLYEQPADLSDGLTTEDGWKIFGGHRLWLAPESALNYYPDKDPVSFELLPNGVTVTQQEDPWLKVQKRLTLTFCDDGSIFVAQQITNTSEETKSFASWGVNTLDSGEAEIFHGAGTPGSYNPERHLSFWGTSSVCDPRIRFEAERIIAKHQPMDTAFKMGVYSREGKAVYKNKNQQFVLSFEADTEKTYPDGGCNFEIYIDKHVLELEALGEICTLKKNESATHWERWMVTPI